MTTIVTRNDKPVNNKPDAVVKTSMFSMRGKIGRMTLVKRLLFACLIMVISPFVMLAFDVVLGLSITNLNYWWIVKAVLFAMKEIATLIKPVWIFILVMLIALRIYGCAIVQRARDIGIEIPTVLLVPFYLLYKANMGKLVFERSIHAEQPHVSNSDDTPTGLRSSRQRARQADARGRVEARDNIPHDRNSYNFTKLSYLLLLIAFLSVFKISTVSADCSTEPTMPREIYDLYNPLNQSALTKELTELSAQGNAEAKYHLAKLMMRYGNEEEKLDAVELLIISATAGYLYAQSELGLMLYDMKKYNEAAEWLLTASRCGYRGRTTWALSKMYEKGLGVPRNKLIAKCWAKVTLENPNSSQSMCES